MFALELCVITGDIPVTLWTFGPLISVSTEPCAQIVADLCARSFEMCTLCCRNVYEA